MDKNAKVYQLPIHDVVMLLGTNTERGLEAADAQARLSEYGPNLIPSVDGPGPLVRFLLQFHAPLVYILLATTIITALLNEWVDSLVIFGVVLVNAMVGFIQESSAAKALSALARTTVTEANVLRSGHVRRISSSELVPGDIVLIQSGDKVPADLRLFHCRDLQVDESALTGESLPVLKDIVPTANVDLAERHNVAFTTTLVTSGQARGVVFATGIRTEVGHISRLISTADSLETPLTRQIARFSRWLLFVIVGLATLTFVVGWMRGQPAVEMFMAAVALSVSAIPEGLPAAVTITLSIGVARMAKRRAIIRKLPAVETLGSTTVVCSDKTGTLTVNQMTVVKIVAGSVPYDVSGTGYEPLGSIAPANDSGRPFRENAAAIECVLAGLLCNDSALIERAGSREVHGDPTEGALLTSAGKAGLDRSDSNKLWRRIDSVPFESQHQYMATLHHGSSGSPPRVYVKGAAEVLLSKSANLLDADGIRVPIDVTRVHEQVATLASQGLRLLAFAYTDLLEGTNSITHEQIANLTFLGLQGMIDPPRSEALHAVRVCQSAGIQVKMITGDHALTAQAIAREIGLHGRRESTLDTPLVLTGADLNGLSDAQLKEAVNDVAVFARVSPEQKLRLVRALQAQNHIVAMTGDGVNDAPALKQADIGVAMGIQGTEVAKEAADMILTDDNFATIEAAIEEGRGVFDNLTKFIVWTLPTSIGEGLVILVAILAGVTLPIVPVQILWINMTTALLLGLMLAFEPQEADIMQRSPRSPGTPILTGVLIRRIFIVSAIMLLGAFGSFHWVLATGTGTGLDHEISEARARTVAVNVFVMVELFYLFNCRSLTRSIFQQPMFSNRWVWVGVTGMVMLQLVFTYVPFMNRIFESTSIGWTEWGMVFLIAIATLLIVEFEKWSLRKD
ncbi:MAG: cation-transporting P-type ATPase [Planctomycetaceae bacterium]|nr:cation-transporting P-type ATPase [Planctomycetaceae bacterium]